MGKALLVVVLLFVAFVLFGMYVSGPETDALHSAEDAVRAQLRDGDSAEFRNVSVYRTANGHLTVCGEVNGRNGFGGMAGFSRFWYVGGQVAIIEDSPGSSVFEELWARQGCDGSQGSAVLSR